MPQSNDATPAYRGYRLQALYALSRILDQEEDRCLVFRPEYSEDLSIQDETGNLLEVIQVKSGDLKLSSFKESFFKRVNSLIKYGAPHKIILASFGKVGPELHRAIDKDGPDREHVASKLKEKYGGSIYSHEDAKAILEKLELVFLDEQKLIGEVYGYIRNTLTGIDPDSAFDLLNFWLYICSEKKSAITRTDIIKKIGNIGKFLAARAAYHDEWFRSIKPIEDLNINPGELAELRKEFYQGISARYDHILANIDVPRPDIIQDINGKFKESQVVIIHGASGQGKTTLAYRYLHDYFPNMWRFKIELIENKWHALNIALAIVGHADAIDIPVAIYLDVSAKDTDWPVLIEQLAFHRNIKVLVTIREEDYNRASIRDFEIQIKDVDLTFNKIEAHEIYKSLEKTKNPPQFLSFEEAWDKFGGEGPLMEFIHLVTQGASLRKRLKEQVTRLENDARYGEIEPGEIELLRFVSVASAFDAQLKVKPLVDRLKLSAPQRTFELFEKEYLVRLSEDGSLVRGLHPIRSEILADLLTDPAIFPWKEYAINILTLIYEPDIESFLLYSFSRRKNDTEPLLIALNSWQPNRWAAIGGITRALIWLGIFEYAEINRELIRDAFDGVGSSFIWLLDSDISNAMPGVVTSSWESLCKLGLINEENRRRKTNYSAHQTDKSDVFIRAKAWLLNRSSCPEKPQCIEDWSGIAESSFWLGYFEITWPFSEQVPYLELERGIESLPLEVLADLILGLSRGLEAGFATWMASNQSRIINRFRDETQTVNLQEEGHKVIAHFIIDFEKLNNLEFSDHAIEESNNYLHDEAMRRIKLLRGLLPDRDTYACQGYGHKVWCYELPFDDTQKAGIPLSQLPPRWLVQANSTFRGLAEYPYRSKTWEEYAKVVFELREQTLIAMKYLEDGLKVYFRKQKPDQLFGKLINAEQWCRYQQMLSKSPLVPSCAVDEWGFVDEFGVSQIEERVIIRGLSLHKHKYFLIIFRKYIQYLSNFINQSIHTMVLNSIRGKGTRDRFGKKRSERKAIKSGMNPGLIRLSRINLSDYIKLIPSFQRLFRQTFGQFFEPSELDDLEKQEIITLHRIWCMWYFFSVSPNSVYRKPEIECVEKVDRTISDIKDKIQKGLLDIPATLNSSYGISPQDLDFWPLSVPDPNGSSHSDFMNISSYLHISVSSYELFWEYKPALWVSIDGKNGIDVYNSVEIVFQEIFKSIDSFRDKELVRLIFGIMWPLIVVVPKIQGKCLANKAWRIDSNTLLWGASEGKLSWWNLVTQYPIPEDALAKLNIDIWDIPQLDVAAKFTQNIFKLSLQLASIRDFKQLPELDDIGINLLTNYIKKIVNGINIVSQIVTDSALEMKDIFNNLSPSEYDKHPSMVGSMRALIEMSKYLLMPVPNSQEGGIVELNTIFEWADMLEEGRTYAISAYLLWASDVVSNENCAIGVHGAIIS